MTPTEIKALAEMAIAGMTPAARAEFLAMDTANGTALALDALAHRIEARRNVDRAAMCELVHGILTGPAAS